MHDLGIFIFRRDLRIENNTAFSNALHECKKIVPIFIFTPEQITKNVYKSNKSVQFMIESLEDLERNIKKKGGMLYTFYGNYSDILSYLIKNYKVDAIYLNKDYTPYSKKRDKNIETICKSKSISFNSYHDVCLLTPGTITTSNGVYKKFTPFYNKCLNNFSKITSVISLKFKDSWCGKILSNKYTYSLTNAYNNFITPIHEPFLSGGRKNALDIVKNIKQFCNYDENRNTLSESTTHLSAFLKYGCISSKEVLFTLLNKGFDKSHALIRQLFWRDFYIHILDAYPHVLQGKSFKPKYDLIKWDNNMSYFNSWKDGKTGFPIVDACMRQLNNTGYMHNRGRLIVASFLIKTLLIDWRKGEKYFAQNLIDYDPAANNGNWQWVAGSGVDSQPYFRIFNPWSQSEKYDKDAKYIKKWCPELFDVPPKDIHKWYKTNEKYIEKGIKYNKPIVDYSKMRKIVLEKYAKYLG